MVRIHIHQTILKNNKVNGDRDAPIICKEKNGDVLCHKIDIKGSDGKVVASVLYRPDDPMPEGPTCWIEIYGDYVTSGEPL